MPSVEHELSEEKKKHRVGLLMYITLFNKAFCIGKYPHTPPPIPHWGKEYRMMSFGGKYVKMEEKTEEA